MATEEVKQDQQLTAEVEELRGKLAIKAQKSLHHHMPQKVLFLDQLIKSDELFTLNMSELEKPDYASILEAIRLRCSPSYSSSSSSSSSSPSSNSNSHSSEEPEMKRRRKCDTSSLKISSNQFIIKLMTTLKKELLELIENVNAVKIWIQLNIPRIEGGDNFGVNIQEDTVSELGRSEDSAFSMFESMSKYFISRAKLVSKVIKYPEIEDYKRSIRELDEKELINLRLCAVDLRNNYAILYDIVIKNLENLKTPRASNHMDSLF